MGSPARGDLPPCHCFLEAGRSVVVNGCAPPPRWSGPQNASSSAASRRSFSARPESVRDQPAFPANSDRVTHSNASKSRTFSQTSVRSRPKRDACAEGGAKPSTALHEGSTSRCLSSVQAWSHIDGRPRIRRRCQPCAHAAKVQAPSDLRQASDARVSFRREPDAPNLAADVRSRGTSRHRLQPRPTCGASTGNSSTEVIDVESDATWLLPSALGKGDAGG